MRLFLSKRLHAYTKNNDVINQDFKTSILPLELEIDDIDFTNARGSVRLCDHSVLTPAEENRMLEEILAFEFGK